MWKIGKCPNKRKIEGSKEHFFGKLFAKMPISRIFSRKILTMRRHFRTFWMPWRHVRWFVGIFSGQEQQNATFSPYVDQANSRRDAWHPKKTFPYPLSFFFKKISNEIWYIRRISEKNRKKIRNIWYFFGKFFYIRKNQKKIRKNIKSYLIYQKKIRKKIRKNLINQKKIK